MIKINLSHLSKAVLKSLIGTLVAVIAQVIVYLVLSLKGIVAPQTMNGSLGFLTLSVVNALCCLFIVKHSPISILVVPIVINSFIMMAFFLCRLGSLVDSCGKWMDIVPNGFHHWDSDPEKSFPLAPSA